jgi:hypothetical protein
MGTETQSQTTAQSRGNQYLKLWREMISKKYDRPEEVIAKSIGVKE